jgi:hypothetical protein
MNTNDKEIRNMLLLLHAEVRFLRRALFTHLEIDDSDKYKFANELSEAIREADEKHRLLVRDFPHLCVNEQ